MANEVTGLFRRAGECGVDGGCGRASAGQGLAGFARKARGGLAYLRDEARSTCDVGGVLVEVPCKGAEAAAEPEQSSAPATVDSLGRQRWIGLGALRGSEGALRDASRPRLAALFKHRRPAAPRSRARPEGRVPLDDLNGRASAGGGWALGRLITSFGAERVSSDRSNEGSWIYRRLE